MNPRSKSRWPAEFYYEESSSQPQYTCMPRGRLVPKRLVEGREDFWQAATGVNYKKKALYIPNIKLITESVLLISDLCKDGFEVYYSANKKLIKVTPDDAYMRWLGHRLDCMAIGDPDDQKDVLARFHQQRQLQAEHVCLLSQEFLQSEDFVEDAIESSLQTSLYLSKIKSDRKPSHHRRYHTLTVETDQLSQEDLSSLNPYHMENITRCRLHSLNADLLGELLSKMPYLRELSIVCNTDTLALPASLNMDSLREIHLNLKGISNLKPLLELLKHAKNVEVIAIEDYKQDYSFMSMSDPEYDQAIESAKFQSLRCLYLSDVLMCTKEFSALLMSVSKNAPLEILHFSGELVGNPHPDLSSLLGVEVPPITLPSLKQGTVFNRNQYSHLPSDDRLTEFLRAHPQVQLVFGTKPGPQLDHSVARTEAPYRSKATMSADTSPEKCDYGIIQRIFYATKQGDPHPDPRMYRLAVYNKVDVNSEICPPSRAFTLTHLSDDLELVDLRAFTKRSAVDVKALIDERNRHTLQSERFYYAKTPLLISASWRPLPSLEAHESLVDYHTDAEQIEIKRSLRDDLYYIRSTDNSTRHIQIDYLVFVDENRNQYSDATLREFREYGIGSLTLKHGVNRGQDYLDAILKQRVGACVHRSIAYKTSKAPDSKYIRISTNDLHAFIEIKVSYSSTKIDLGGYPADFTIEEANNPYANAGEAPSQQQDHPPLHVKDRYPTLVRRLSPWKEKKKDAANGKSLIDTLTHKSTPRILVKSAEPQALQLALQRQCQQLGQPVCYIHQPSELACMLPGLLLHENGKGVVKPAPFGRVYDFLTQQYDQTSPRLIVNYATFKAEDIAKFNSLLDKDRRVDGVPLPDNMVVVGLINPNVPTCYQGSDFYSRFDRVKTDANLTANLDALVTTVDKHEGYVINLYHDSNWRERLIGRWKLLGHQFQYHYGALYNYLANPNNPRVITIQNGLWNDHEFVNFWQQVLLTRKIEHDGRVIILPQDLRFVQSDGYDWTNLLKKTHWKPGLVDDAITLNASTLQKFEEIYQCANEELFTTDGWFSVYSGKTMSVNLTHTLSSDQFAAFLAGCCEHRITLQCHVAANVLLPKEITGEEPNYSRTVTLPEWQSDSGSSSLLLLQSGDIDATAALIKQDGATWIDIDISECSSADLITSLDLISRPGEIDQLKFTNRPGILDQLQHHNVILRGEFSLELSEALADYLLSYSKKINHHTRLVLISNDMSLQQYLLVQRHAIPEKNIAVDPALLTVPSVLSTLAGDSFNQQRILQVRSALLDKPYVFLSGLSGTGKTTFVDNILANEPDVTVYQSEQAIAAWANDRSGDHLKILFIDEANITNRQWSEFESMFNNNPPGIIHGNQYIPLTRQHKIIFAGNPMSYSGERLLAPLFQRHGNALIFDMIPSNIIQHEILGSITDNLQIQATVLKLYEYLCSISTTDVLITPRELRAITHLSVSHLLQDPTADATQTTAFYAYMIGKELVDNQHRVEFEQLFKPTNASPIEAFIPSLSKSFIVTPSRRPLIALLSDFLAVRNQGHFGLGGMVIEGESGIGKSELVRAVLEAKQIDYDVIPVALDYDKKAERLIKAFHEGRVVIVDEINSSPTMERLLNKLLMGTDEQGNPPIKTGFMLIGTQNPITMAGRRVLGSALSRRLLTITLPPYPKSEMIDFLIRRGLERTIAIDMVEIFSERKAYAEAFQKAPVPNFRDLLREVHRLTESPKRKGNFGQFAAANAEKSPTEKSPPSPRGSK